MRFVRSPYTFTVFALALAFTPLLRCHAQDTAGASAAVHTMIARETEAAKHKLPYTYTSVERSDRTGGHLWTERVVEMPLGRVRFLIAEDGQPLSPDRVAAERGRLAADIQNPQAFADKEKAQKDEEAHARALLDLLGKGFILDGAIAPDGDWHIRFSPDPNYSPSGMEERVMHAMSGTMLIDSKAMRLRHIEGTLPQDLNLFIIATVKAGSHFETTKAPIDGNWRTMSVINDIHGKAALFKTIAKNQSVVRSNLKRVPEGLTMAQAVALAEQ